MSFLANEGLDDCGSKIDSNFAISGGRTWLMYFNAADSEAYVRQNCTYSIYDSHPDEPNVYVTSVSVSGGLQCNFEGVAARQWIVQVEYGTFTPLRPIGGPLAQPRRWSLVPYLKAEPAYVDQQGVPILNSAGDPFNPPLEIERMCYTLTITQNETGPDIGAILGVSNKVNASSWLVFAAKTAKLLPVEIPEKQYDNESGQAYYAMKYTFDIDPETWKAKVLNQGFRESRAGKLVQIMGDDGEPVNDPVLLDENGLKLTYPATDSSIVIKEFDLHETTDFSAFGFDNLFS